MSIIALVAGLFCGGCLGAIPGIVALVQSGKVNDRWWLGDVDGAHNAARLARTWSIVSFVLTGVALVLAVIWFVLAAATTAGRA